MQKKTYAELLKDPRWQKKRLEIMQRDNFTCQHCGRTDRSLQVHHSYYLMNNNPWEYNDESLITLCDKCHEDETMLKNEIERAYNALKHNWGRVGLSRDLFLEVLWKILRFINNNDYPADERQDTRINEMVSRLIYESECGIQYPSDYVSLSRLGIDCSEIMKHTNPRLLEDYNLKKSKNEEL